MSNFEQHLDKVKNSMIEEISRNANLAYHSLIENMPLNKIPESIFVNYFLPCFLGEVNNQRWVLEWISIAGSPVNEVSVVKDGTTQELFRVPGLFSSNNLFLNNPEVSISDIFARHSQINSNMPLQSMKYLSDALGHTYTDIMKSHNPSKTQTAWNHILERYNISKPSSVQTQQPKPNEDMFEY